jgi:signal transduction histidine kinase
MVTTIAKNGIVRNLETNLRTKQGDIRRCLFSSVLITLNGQKCLLSTINDITELKQLEKEMARLDRLNLVGEMAAGIGHEIRNPMTAVRGFLQILGNKEEFSNYKSYYDIMIEELDRANSIITEYLSLAKNKMVEKKQTNINSILEALSPLIQSDALKEEKNVRIDQGEVPDLFLDEKEIRQLILNLVRNGLEAMSPGGNLTIKTYMHGQKAVLSVKVEGKGISPEHLEKIGTPFFTTKDNGTGLGLAVCYSIAARHKATIKVDTNASGSTFSIRFKPTIQRHLSP